MIKKVEPYKGIAGIYEEIRPSYPERLIEDVISKADLKLNDILLEVGAGTGKATIQFAEKGFKINAVELGEDMAEILKDKCANYPSVSVDIASFEEWNSPNNQKYDMIYSAQAFHWIDKNIKYKKCHELLKDKGYLILFWYNPSNDKLDKTSEIQEKIDMIVNKYVSNYFNDNGKANPTFGKFELKTARNHFLNPETRYLSGAILENRKVVTGNLQHFTIVYLQ